MAIAATETTSILARTLPSTRYTPMMARYYVRLALTDHDLYDYAGAAAAVTSELITNAVIHTDADTIGLELAHLQDRSALAIVVTDPSPHPPVKYKPSEVVEHGRGLLIVEALSTRWGWQPRDPGKAVYAILTREG